MPRRREPRPAIMPRRRGPPRPHGDRRLAEEVLYLHSLWRRATPAPAPAPIQSHSAGLKTANNKRQRLGRGAAAEPQDTESEWPIALPPPNSSPKPWPEAAAPSSSRAHPPRHPRSPGVLVQWKALRASAEFFSNHGASSSSDDDSGSDSEGEQDAAGFITGLFERDAALRGHYERGWEEAQFACIACAGGSRAGRRFRGCVALVQHARDASNATRYGRPRAHRALAAVLCRVLGWNIASLPTIVKDPRGTLGQAHATGAKAGVRLAKENGDTGENNDSSSDEDEEEDVETVMEDSSTDFDEEDSDLESSEESSEQEDVENGMEDSENTDDDEEAIELDNSEKSTEKEEKEEKAPSSWKDYISKNEVLRDESVQEVNASKDDSLNQGNNGEVHKQQIAKESSEQENTNGTHLLGSNEEHCKEASVQKEENVDENEEEHVESTS